MIFIQNKKYEDERLYYIYDYDNNLGIAYIMALNNLDRMDIRYTQLASMHNKSRHILFVNLSESSFTKLNGDIYLTQKYDYKNPQEGHIACYTDWLDWRSFFYEDEEDDYMVGFENGKIVFWHEGVVRKVLCDSSKFYAIYKEEGVLHVALYNNMEYILDGSGLYLYDDSVEQEFKVLETMHNVTRYQMRMICGFEEQV